MTSQRESYEERTVRYNAWLEAVWYETKGVPEFVFGAWNDAQADQAERVGELEIAFDELLREYRKEVKLYSGQDTEFTVRMHNARVPK